MGGAETFVRRGGGRKYLIEGVGGAEIFVGELEGEGGGNIC